MRESILYLDVFDEVERSRATAVAGVSWGVAEERSRQGDRSRPILT